MIKLDPTKPIRFKSQNPTSVPEWVKLVAVTDTYVYVEYLRNKNIRKMFNSDIGQVTYVHAEADRFLENIPPEARRVTMWCVWDTNRETSKYNLFFGGHLSEKSAEEQASAIKEARANSNIQIQKVELVEVFED